MKMFAQPLADPGDGSTPEFPVPDTPQAAWELTEDCKVTYGRDGDEGPWIVYVSAGPGEDVYVEVTAGQLREHAERILWVLDNDPRRHSASVGDPDE